MTGYWIVVAMVVLALIATAVAVTREEPATSVAQRSEPRVVQGNERRVVWQVWSDLDAPPVTAMAPDQIDWVERLHRSIGHALTIERIRIPQSPVTELSLERTGDRPHSAPDVIICWVGITDVVNGSSIVDFEARLATVLPHLSAGGGIVMLGNLPSLLLERQSDDRFRATTPIPFAKRHWNSAIARAALRHGFRVADLSGELVTVVRSVSGDCDLTAASQLVVAERFRSYVNSANDEGAQEP